MAEEQSNGEYDRPRRPTPDTVTYLSGLPLDEGLAAQQAREYVEYFRNRAASAADAGDDDRDGEEGSEPPEYPPMLGAAHAAVSSVFREFASLACEEIPSRQIETLVRISCRYSLVAKRVILASMAGYWVFLSTHRFGSHVAQTVLRCVVAECEENLDEFDDGQGGEEEEEEHQREGKMVIEDSYGSLLENEDGGGGDGDVPPSLSGLLLQTLEELRPYATELSVHVCGTHVVRSAICIMAGAELVEAFPKPVPDSQTGGAMGDWDTGALGATRRGKLKDKKKKKKKKWAGPAEDERESSSPQVATIVKEMKVVQELQSEDFRRDADALLYVLVGVLSMSDEKEGGKVQPPGELQEQTCHPSAGPLLIQILRLLSYRDFHSRPPSKKRGSTKEIEPDRRLGILPPEPKYGHGSHAESLVYRLLCWDPSIANDGKGDRDDGGESAAKQPYSGDIIYGLSGEPRGSILLEAIFRCCPDEFHDALCDAGGFYDESALRAYVHHGVSNFVVQTLLTSVRTKEQVSRMVKCVCGILEDGSVLKRIASGAEDDNAGPGSRRMGIAWRAFEMCAAKGGSQDQEQVLSALMRGFASTTTLPQEDESADANNGDKKRKKRSKAKGLSVEECIPRLLGLTPGSCEDGSRLTLDAAGARVLYHIFQFKERLRKDWVTCFLSIYGCEDVVKIANDGLGSRCVMDGLLDGPARSIASKLLVPKLSDRILFLATERVGHHTVEKLFRALPVAEDKAALSAELSHSLNKLGSNAMGRSVMTTCAVKEYLEGESVWREALAKQKQKDHWLEEILGEKESAEGGADDEPKTKKRKKDKKEKKKKRRKNSE